MIKINNKINQLKKYYVPLLLNNQIHLENKIKKEGKQNESKRICNEQR